MLELERRIHTTELGGSVFETVEDDPTVRCPDHSHRVDDVGAVGSFREIDAHHGTGRSCVPELECLIPGPCHHTGICVPFDPVHCLHWPLMLCYLNHLIAPQIPHLHALVA